MKHQGKRQRHLLIYKLTQSNGFFSKWCENEFFLFIILLLKKTGKQPHFESKREREKKKEGTDFESLSI